LATDTCASELRLSSAGSPAAKHPNEWGPDSGVSRLADHPPIRSAPLDGDEHFFLDPEALALPEANGALVVGMYLERERCIGLRMLDRVRLHGRVQTIGPAVALWVELPTVSLIDPEPVDDDLLRRALGRVESAVLPAAVADKCARLVVEAEDRPRAAILGLLPDPRADPVVDLGLEGSIAAVERLAERLIIGAKKSGC
jgi:hypothetical protein